MSTKENIKNRIEDLRFHRDTCHTILKHDTNSETQEKMLKREIFATNKVIKELNSLLLDLYLEDIKAAYPKADAIYEDAIILCIGEEYFTHLHSKGKIQLCAYINGRRLYAL